MNGEWQVVDESVMWITTLSISGGILLLSLAYGIYMLLGDCFTSMVLAFLTSLYLWEFKNPIIKGIQNSLKGNYKIWKRAYLIWFFIFLYNFDKKKICDCFKIRVSNIFSSYYIFACVFILYYFVQNHGVPMTLLVYIILLVLDLVFKLIAYLIINTIIFFKGDSKLTAFHSIVTVFLMIVFLILFIASIGLLVFLFVLDLEKMRWNLLLNSSFDKFLD